MNKNLFSKLLAHEAANLYHQHVTPEIFMDRIIPLLASLEDESRAELMSENGLGEILVSSKPKKNSQAQDTNSFYDVVDLAMYRAN